MIQLADLKIGMYLKNDGKNAIPVYDGSEGTGKPVLNIKPGEMIGKIFDFHNGPNGATVLFGSEAITSALPVSEKAVYYVFLSTFSSITGSVNFDDLAANVSSGQVQEQQIALDNAAAHGVSLSNTIKKVTKEAGETVSEAAESIIPWKLVLAAGGVYVLLNWNKFFTPTRLK
jgi:hypothetical protein